MVWRGAVLLWAAFFAIVGARGLLDPASYTETFGFTISGVAINTLRADLSSFFLVSAGAAALGALVPAWVRALLVPAALYGTRSEEHTSELQSLMRISYAVFCLKKK